MKIRLLLVLLLVVMSSLAACGGDDDNDESATYTIGVLSLASSLDPIYDAFKADMETAGFTEGDTVEYVYEGVTNSVDALPEYADRLVEADPDMILAFSTPAALAAMDAIGDQDIVLIFTPITDPVGVGLVESMSQPGVNRTGVTDGIFSSKGLDWLVKLVPSTSKVFAPHNPNDAAAVAAYNDLVMTADGLGVEVVSVEVATSEDVVAALDTLPDDVDAIQFLADSTVIAASDDLIAYGLEHQIPVVGTATHTEDGAFMGFGPRLDAIGAQTARLARQVLEGAPASSTPVETAEYFLTLNIATADAIGIELTNSQLNMADTVVRPGD